MDKSEYAEVRDDLLRALTALEAVRDGLIDEAYDWGFRGDLSDVDKFLDERGHWIDGDEFHRLTRPLELLEQLVGRAHARSV